MQTALARVVSEKIGFTRGIPDSRGRAGWLTDRLRRRLALPEYNDRQPYLPCGCDNGVAANHFIDINRFGPKFNIPLTSYVGLTPGDGAFGQNISGLLFHFALSTRALSRERREVSDAGDAFNYWVTRLHESQGLDHTVLREMVEISTRFQPGGYDGSIPQSWYEKEYSAIQHYLARYRSAWK